MEALAVDREDERLVEPDREERRADADAELAQDGRARDVGETRGELAEEVVLLRRRRRLAEAQCDEGGGRAEERPGVDERDDGAAERGVQPRARERRDEPQAFADRLEGAVRVAQQLVGQHRLHHRRRAAPKMSPPRP